MTEPERGLMENYYAKETIGRSQYYWGMSPSIFYDNYVRVHDVATGGNGDYDIVNFTYGVRPVITIKPDAEIEEGEGSYENPYVIAAKITR